MLIFSANLPYYAGPLRELVGVIDVSLTTKLRNARVNRVTHLV